VTYFECTVGDHVFHARYLYILDRARGEWFRHLGQPLLELQRQDAIFSVTECQLRYKAPARYDDQIVVEMRVTEVSRVRMTLGYRIVHADGRTLVEAEIVYACTTVEGRPRRLPPELDTCLSRILQQ